MNNNIQIRRLHPGEASALLKVFYSAVHLVACYDYTAEQLDAWAPKDIDASCWEQHIANLNPFVVEWEGEVVGYADIQASGYIDHFFVSAEYARKGIGSQLMEHLLSQARLLGVSELTANVSRTAQPLFEKFGFVLVERRYPERRGVVIENAFMRRILETHEASA